MALVEKVSQEDLIVYEILRNPVLANEFIENYDKQEWVEEFKYTSYQKDMLCDFNPRVTFCTARAVGKTEAEKALLRWALIYNLFPNDYLVYTVPNKNHLQPVWNALTITFRTNSFLKNFIPSNAGFNSSSFEVKLLNGAMLDCRIAGTTGDGRNVIGIHSPFELLDEGGYYPWGTWIELQPTLNTFTKGHKLVVAGVPTGERERNVLYYADQEDDSYTKHRVSAYENPRWTKKDEEDAVVQYGNKESDDFIHMVLGKHGAPVFAIFDRNLMELEGYPVYKLVINGIKYQKDMNKYIAALSSLPDAPSNKGVIFGIDFGYTDPTAIVIMYLTNTGQIKFHARVQLNKVAYPIQETIVDRLDSRFKPVLIGADEGSAGVAPVQGLQNKDMYLHKRYDKKLIGINFASNISMGFDADGNEIKNKAKPLSVSVLQEYTNQHKIIYSHRDLELITELERMTYTKTPSGEIVYRTKTERGGNKGDDHFTSAMLCFALAYYLENEQIVPARRNVKLFTGRWTL